jgi:hypothetical protein
MGKGSMRCRRIRSAFLFLLSRLSSVFTDEEPVEKNLRLYTSQPHPPLSRPDLYFSPRTLLVLLRPLRRFT